MTGPILVIVEVQPEPTFTLTVSGIRDEYAGVDQPDEVRLPETRFNDRRLDESIADVRPLAAVASGFGRTLNRPDCNCGERPGAAAPLH